MPESKPETWVIRNTEPLYKAITGAPMLSNLCHMIQAALGIACTVLKGEWVRDYICYICI